MARSFLDSSRKILDACLCAVSCESLVCAHADWQKRASARANVLIHAIDRVLRSAPLRCASVAATATAARGGRFARSWTQRAYTHTHDGRQCDNQLRRIESAMVFVRQQNRLCAREQATRLLKSPNRLSSASSGVLCVGSCWRQRPPIAAADSDGSGDGDHGGGDSDEPSSSRTQWHRVASRALAAGNES